MTSPPDGLIVVDKPAGMTSHDVVSRVRRLARTRRVGHGGTLDPMATGVLIVGVGKATRLLTYVIGSDKKYDGTIRLGQSTITDDAEGEVVASRSASLITDDQIRAGLETQTGDIMQTPSAVSAIKIEGKRAYKMVRAGEEVTLAPRPVRVSSLVATDIRRQLGADVIDVDVSVACSTGTYIRAIARDLGSSLDVGGHLTVLRRTAVGGFDLSAAVALPELEARVERGESPISLTLDEAVERFFATRVASTDEERTLSHGGPLSPMGLPSPYAVFSEAGHVIAIVTEREGKARAEVVFAPA